MEEHELGCILDELVETGDGQHDWSSVYYGIIGGSVGLVQASAAAVSWPIWPDFAARGPHRNHSYARWYPARGGSVRSETFSSRSREGPDNIIIIIFARVLSSCYSV